MITPLYEDWLQTYDLRNSVLGYRSGIGSNIHHAAGAFNEVSQRGTCVAVAYDLESFFDTICHRELKHNLIELLDCDWLPADWHAVYKAMTRYAYVDESELHSKLGLNHSRAPRPICSIQTFRDKVRGGNLINTNNDVFGIPQGAAISAIFSNIAMMRFDLAMHRYCKARSYSYRRYSDDILIIGDDIDCHTLEQDVENYLSQIGPALRLNRNKTSISRFTKPSGSPQCDKPVDYLGFVYDGNRVFLRGRALSRYYRRMTYATRASVRASRKNGSLKIHKRKLISDFTHLGKKNFYTYAKRAVKITGSDGPTRQLRRHFKILYRKLENAGR